MKNYEVARQFDLMADVLELRGENPFRIRAYRRAARNLEALTEDVAVVAREDRLDDIPGIGRDLAGKIAEYLRTGRMKDLDAATRGIPRGVVEMMHVPGIGPKTAKLLYDEERITGIDALERRARAGTLKGVQGIQAKTEQNILKGIRLVRGGQERMSLGKALVLGQELVRALERVRGVDRVSVAGSLRRMKETVGDVDLLVTSGRPERVIHAFTHLEAAADVVERGETKAAIRHREGIQVDLRVVEPKCFGAALVYFTGSKAHGIRLRARAMKRGLKISEYGVFRSASGRRVAGATEEEVYAAVGLPWIPPELREDRGEIEAASAGTLPHLVTLGDVRGDLHCHTNASDGQHSIEALVAAAERRGYGFVAVTDHSPSTRVTGGLDVPALRAHVTKIRAVQAKHPRITVLAGTECDILPDGTLDYPDAVLAELDLVVAAVHSRFKQSRAAMTRRLVKALAHPSVTVLGHPTGRLIGERAPYDVDLERVLRAAARHGTAIEINGYPERLDLDDVHARRAHELGVPIALGTDTHMLDHLGYMELAVATARRGWVETSAVVNTWPREQLAAWLARHRGARARRALA
ncbi:MAG: DNA polymerase/3'-5' exonuclease PolX [Candidatus Rokubacteria bacterium]|nr:DNA polymerase/3'-5' exonuclease PolX [Candidatus Rokubacteria bacterium]